MEDTEARPTEARPTSWQLRFDELEGENVRVHAGEKSWTGAVLRFDDHVLVENYAMNNPSAAYVKISAITAIETSP